MERPRTDLNNAQGAALGLILGILFWSCLIKWGIPWLWAEGSAWLNGLVLR